MDVNSIVGNNFVSEVMLMGAEKIRRPLTLKDVTVETEMTEEQCGELLIILNEFRDTFAVGPEELECTDIAVMDIIEEKDSRPVVSKPYQTSVQERRIISRILEEWKQQGIISDINSPYASPVILVDKANGQKRLCVDFRKLNKQTVQQPYPMADIDLQLSELANGKLFSVLDLFTGYL